LISITFVETELEELWDRLEAWQNNTEQGMTRDKYFSMCDQLNQEPNPTRIPPDLEDFPVDVQKALIIFNKLGDRVVADIGYLGKDYTQLPVYFDAYNITNKRLCLEVLLRLDSRLIKNSADKMKAEREKIKRQNKP